MADVGSEVWSCVVEVDVEVTGLARVALALRRV